MKPNHGHNQPRINLYRLTQLGVREKKYKILGCCLFVAMLLVEGFIFMETADAKGEVAGEENSAATGRSMPGAGSLYFQAEDGQRVHAVSLNSAVRMDISGVINRVTVTQVFKNTGPDWQQGLYVFPLPEDSSVDRLTIKIGDRLIKGEIQLREIAEKKYQAALKAGKKASVVHQHRPNLFSTKIANIAPGEEVSVEIAYLQKVHIDGAVFSVRFPMTITPRYSPGGFANKKRKDTDRESEGIVSSLGLLSLFDLNLNRSGASNTASMDIQLNSGFSLSRVSSPSHKLLINNEPNNEDEANKAAALGGESLQINFEAGRVNMDKDFVLEWSPAIASTPSVSFFSEAWAGEFFGLLMVMPGELRSFADVELISARQTSALKVRELIFVIDTSGSMGGASITQAKASLKYALSRLRPSDLFNIIEFNSDAKGLFSHSKYASRSNIKLAQRFSDSLTSNGGTNILDALALMFSSTSDDSSEGKQTQFVFITDGSVSNEAELFSLIRNRITQSRLFTIGIGSAPNRYFMRKAAEYGKGSFTHIASIHEVEQKITALFKKIAAPQLVDVLLIADSNADLESYPSIIPDLYSDQPLIIAMKSSTAFGDFRLLGKINGLDWEKEIVTQLGAHSGIASLYGRARIEFLEDERHVSGNKAVFTEEIKAAALFHKLVSRYTSLIAVEEFISRPSHEKINTARIKNLLPHGSTMKARSKNGGPGPSITMGYPRTASNAIEALQRSIAFIGLALLLLLASLFRHKMSATS